MFAFISLFFTSFLAIFTLEKIDKKETREYIILYPLSVAITNIITLVITRIVLGHIDNFYVMLNSETMLFVYYSLFALCINFIITLLYVILSKVFKLNIVEEKNGRKKHRK